MKKEDSEVVSATTQLKLLAPDGKKRMADVLDSEGIIALGKEFPSKKANRFMNGLPTAIEGASIENVGPKFLRITDIRQDYGIALATPPCYITFFPKNPYFSEPALKSVL